MTNANESNLTEELYKRINEIKKPESNEYNRFVKFWRACADGKYRTFQPNSEYIRGLASKLNIVREELISNFDSYKDKAIKSLQKLGVKVYVAKTKEDALKYFFDEVGSEKIIPKSKNTDVKEIHLAEECKKRGITLLETDLGDVIVDLTGEKAQWSLGPGCHIEIPIILKAIKEKYNKELPPDPAIISHFLRDKTREIILQSNVSLTGANAISADNGTIVTIENEGNISLLSRLAKKHIVITGIHKITPTIFDAVLTAHIDENINTLTAAYISLIRGPSATADVQGVNVIGMYGAQEVIVIFLDLWQSKYKDHPLFRQYLKCISCKSCDFVCSAEIAIGNAFRSEQWLGASGIIRDYLLNGVEDAVKDGVFACVDCECCKNWCPVGINYGDMLKEIKREASQRGIYPQKLKTIADRIKNQSNPFK